MKAWSRSILVALLAGLAAMTTVMPSAKAEGELAVLFEDEVEFNARIASELLLGKFHGLDDAPEDAVLFFNLFCEGNLSGIGGTEVVTKEAGKTFFENGGGEVFFDMTICEFCQCAGLEGQAFEDCHNANESCVTINNAHFLFNPLISDDLPPDPAFPDGVRFLFTMTEHDPATECTGRFLDLCNQGTLDLIHYCTHVLDSMGNVLKSISSAYIFTTKPQ